MTTSFTFDSTSIFSLLEPRKLLTKSGYSFIWLAWLDSQCQTQQWTTGLPGWYVVKVSRFEEEDAIVLVNEKRKKKPRHNSKEKCQKAMNREIKAYQALQAFFEKEDNLLVKSLFVVYYGTVQVTFDSLTVPFTTVPSLVLECFSPSKTLTKWMGAMMDIDNVLQKEQWMMVIVQKLIKAVQICHQAGFAHHDLKPDNILVYVTPEKVELKLIDFGLSQPFGSECKECGGTPMYSAPEILCNEDHGSTYIDSWSLGAIVYELMTGNPLLFCPSMTEYRFQCHHIQLETDPTYFSSSPFAKWSANAQETIVLLVQKLVKDIPSERMLPCAIDCEKPLWVCS